MKFKLEAQIEEYKIQVEFEELTLPPTLESIEYFLKGCGFVFDGLEIIKKDEE